MHAVEQPMSTSDETPRTPLEKRAIEEIRRQQHPSWPANARVPVVCREWCDRCWHRWLRARTLEHVYGQQYWKELDRGDCAILRRRSGWHAPLIEEIVRLMQTCDDNLAVMRGVVRQGLSVSEAAAILLEIKLNTRRIARFPFLPPLRR